jgi:hypothetical protein
MTDLTRRCEDSINDVGTRIGALEATIEQQSEKLISLMEEKHLSTEERSALEVIEKALAERSFLETDAETIAHNITNNGFADINILHSNVVYTLARKYPLCSTDLYFSAYSCGECRMRIFATKSQLVEHVDEEIAKKKEEFAKKKRAFVESHPGHVTDSVEIDDDGFARPMPRPVFKCANKNVTL